MTPTLRLSLALAVLGAFGLILVTWSGPALVVLALIPLLVGAGLDGAGLLRLPLPRVWLEAVQTVQLRRPFTLKIRVDGSAMIEVRVPPPLGGPMEPTSVVSEMAVELTPRSRGRFEICDTWCLQRSRWGLFQRLTVVATPVTIEVFPDLLGGDDSIGVSQEWGGAAARGGMARASLELRGLRPFVSGDDPRHVDWKATARHRAPVVREWEPERRRTVIFVLDAGRLMRADTGGETKFDAALRATARVASRAAQHGDRVGALVFDSEPLRFVPPLSGARQAFELLQSVNDLQPNLVESDLSVATPYLLAHRRRALVVVVTDVAEPEGGKLVAQATREIARVHVPFTLLVRDPGLERLRGALVRERDDAFVRAAAEIIVRERREVVDSLRSRGCAALDSSTTQIASHALEVYTRARARAAW